MSDEALISVFLIGLVLGPAVGGLVGWRLGMFAGVGIGCLVIGACGTAAAIGFGWKGWQIVQGVLPADPDHPTWGGEIAFSIFGLLPLAFGLFFAAQAISEAGFGRTFVAIGVAVAVHGVAFIVRRAGDWQQPAVCFIVALGFVLFGTLAWTLG